jgi:hypothetical protein
MAMTCADAQRRKRNMDGSHGRTVQAEGRATFVGSIGMLTRFIRQPGRVWLSVFQVMPGVLMIPTRQLTDYLREQGLKLDRTELQIAVMTLQAVLDVEKPPCSVICSAIRCPS